MEDEEYLRMLVAYIHLNPVRAHLFTRLDSFGWTSHRAYLGRDSAPDWLTLEHMLGLFGGPLELNGFVRSVRSGVIEYPEDFDPESGLFKIKWMELTPYSLSERRASMRRWTSAASCPDLRPLSSRLSKSSAGTV